MNIYIIRHGLSIANVRKNFDPPVIDPNVFLTDTGIRQAKDTNEALATYFSQEGWPSEESTRVFVSPFARTRQTYNNLSNLHKYTKVESDLLSEVDGGLMDIFPLSEVEKKQPMLYKLFTEEFENNRYYANYPCGESAFDVSLRVRFFIYEMTQLKNQGIENIFIVGHGTWIMVFLKVWFDHSVEWYNETPHIRNCDVVKVVNKESAEYIIRKGKVLDNPIEIK